MVCQYSDKSHDLDAFSRLLQEEPSAEQHDAPAENNMSKQEQHAIAYNMYKRSAMLELDQNGYIPLANQPHVENNMDNHIESLNRHNKLNSGVELEQNGYVPSTEQPHDVENNVENQAANAYNMYKKRTSMELESPSLITPAQARTPMSLMENATKPSSSREGSSLTRAQSMLHHRLHLLHRLHMLHRLIMLHRLVQNETV
jgi:hypothetical protein